MSNEVISEAVAALNAKFAESDGFDDTAKFEIDEVGSIMVADGVAAEGDGDADCTISASADTFREIFDGDMDAASAFMSGKLRIDGDMGIAMQLASILG